MTTKRRNMAAFTLIELLIVIVVIAILMALLMPAVMRSRAEMQNTEAKTKIKTIGLAIDSFYNDFGYYPGTSSAFNDATGRFEALPYNDYAYSEALVHCLANKFVKGSGDAVYGGSPGQPNIERVIGNAPVTAGPYLDVKAKDLIDLDGDGWYELADPWGNPFIYIPKDDYVYADGTYRSGALLKNSNGADADPTAVVINAHQQRFKFQLISFGRDEWSPGFNPNNNYRNFSLETTAHPAPEGIHTYDDAGGTNPALIGTDDDLSSPRGSDPRWDRDDTADDINNWRQ